jgi:hypothetical protein
MAAYFGFFTKPMSDTTLKCYTVVPENIRPVSGATLFMA